MKNIGYFVAACAVVCTASLFAGGCGCGARKAPVKKVVPTEQQFTIQEAGCGGCGARKAPARPVRPVLPTAKA